MTASNPHLRYRDPGTQEAGVASPPKQSRLEASLHELLKMQPRTCRALAEAASVAEESAARALLRMKERGEVNSGGDAAELVWYAA